MILATVSATWHLRIRILCHWQQEGQESVPVIVGVPLVAQDSPAPDVAPHSAVGVPMEQHAVAIGLF